MRTTPVLLSLALALAAAAVAQQVPPAGPTATTRSAEDIQQSAYDAFDARDYAKALPLLKDLAVRWRGDSTRVGPVLEKVRVCERNLAQPAVEGINAPRVPHVRPADGQTYEVALQKLGNFAYDAERGGTIPDDVKKLDGITVKLHGYMIPYDRTDNIVKFALVPDLFACCFGQPPSLQHTALVTTPPGKSLSYFAEQIVVTGTLRVNPRQEDGFYTSLFDVAATSIRPMSDK